MVQVSVHTWSRLKNPIIWRKLEFFGSYANGGTYILLVVFYRYYRIDEKFAGDFNLAVWRSPTATAKFNFRHIRTQELRIDILLHNHKSPNLNSGNI